MSKKRWCGYCKLKELEQQAAEDDNLVVTVQLSVDNVGFDVFLHPVDIKIPDHVWRRDEESLPETKYWKTWLLDDYERRGCDC